VTAVGVWKTEASPAVTDRRYNKNNFCMDFSKDSAGPAVI